MINLYIGDKSYRILSNFTHSLSINQVDFSNLTLDFTDKTFEDVPLKYQECTLKEDDEILFVGYVESINLRKISKFKELDLTILSPFKMATIRTASLIGNYKTSKAVEIALAPLISDGFKIVEQNYKDGEITLSYSLETVEKIMNRICNKKGFAWYIDKNKGIHINSIDYMYSQSAVFKIDENSNKTGILSITPQIKNVDYANVLNFKDVKLITFSDDLNPYQITLKKNDTITFKHPIIIDEEYARKQLAEISEIDMREYQDINASNFFYVFFCWWEIGINLNTNKWVFNSNIGFEDDEDADSKSIILIRDEFYKNLITGFRWNSTSFNPEFLKNAIYSEMALKDVTFKYINNREIEKMKGLVSESGIIEKNIDYNGKWTNAYELIETANSMINKNENETTTVTIELEKTKANLGDLITIDLPEYLIKGDFVITKIQNSYNNEIEKKITLTCERTNFLYNYIDIFRAKDSENSLTSVENLTVSYYLDEKINIDTKVVDMFED